MSEPRGVLVTWHMGVFYSAYHEWGETGLAWQKTACLGYHVGGDLERISAQCPRSMSHQRLPSQVDAAKRQEAQHHDFVEPARVDAPLFDVASGRRKLLLVES